MTSHESFDRSFRAGQDLVKGQRVVIDGTDQNKPVVTLSSNTRVSVGTVRAPRLNGEMVAVRLWGWTRECIASAAIGVGDYVGPAANGKVVTDNTNGQLVALTKATADGDIIECAPREQ